MLKNLKVGIIISVAVEVLREILELIFYGEVQLRTVDNIMYIMLVASLYTNYMLVNDLKEVKQMIKLNGKPMPTKKMIGHVNIDDIIISFDFNVPVNADEDDIISAMTEAFLEKINMEYEECDENAEHTGNNDNLS